MIGSRRRVAAFRSVTRFGDRVLAEIHHSGELTAERIAELTRPTLSSWEAARQQRALDELDAATGRRRASFGRSEVWAQAANAKIDQLIIEETCHEAVDAGGDPSTIVPARSAHVDRASIEDAVDELISQVSTTGGAVSIVADGLLGSRRRMGAVLRY